MDVDNYRHDVLRNLYFYVKSVLEREIPPKKRKEMISEIIRNAEDEVGSLNKHIFVNRLNKIKNLIEEMLGSTDRELTRHLRGLLSEIHNYLPQYDTISE